MDNYTKYETTSGWFLSNFTFKQITKQKSFIIYQFYDLIWTPFNIITVRLFSL